MPEPATYIHLMAAVTSDTPDCCIYPELEGETDPMSKTSKRQYNYVRSSVEFLNLS